MTALDRLERCVTCTHENPQPVRALHQNLTAHCRVNGCKCDEFTSAIPTVEDKPTPRRVCVDVPDGYAVHIELVPMTPQEPET